MKIVVIGFIFVLSHVLSWNRAIATQPELANLYHTNKTQLSPSSQEVKNTALNFAEGSAFNVNLKKPVLNFAEGSSKNLNNPEEDLNSSTTLKTLLSTQEKDAYNLLKEGIPASNGTSGIKPRKGVSANMIVPRKGAPPCMENATNSTAGEKCQEETVKPVYEPEHNPTTSTSLLPNKTTASTLEHIPSSSIRPVVKKPSVTVVPADSDELLKTLRSDRNVVIPVLALVCTPIVVLLILFIYKRIQEARGNADYTKMGFLIEDIYND